MAQKSPSAKLLLTRFFVLNSSFTTKDNYFRVAKDETCEAFNKVLIEFGYTQKIEVYDPKCHQRHTPQQHSLYKPQKH